MRVQGEGFLSAFFCCAKQKRESNYKEFDQDSSVSLFLTCLWKLSSPCGWVKDKSNDRNHHRPVFSTYRRHSYLMHMLGPVLVFFGIVSPLLLLPIHLFLYHISPGQQMLSLKMLRNRDDCYSGLEFRKKLNLKSKLI